MLLVITTLQVRSYSRGDRHQHFQVVEWVEEHVDPETWVGAVQTGTLGYFHDRTYNLDGKVSPEALEAVEARRIPAYVVDKDIQHLVDWVGIEDWHDRYPEIRDHFRVAIVDRDSNLAVLSRID